MNALNRLFGAVVQGALWPFHGLPQLVGLGFVAFLTAVAVLLVYRRTSNQDGISAVRRTIVASLLEMRLFRDDVVVVLKAQGSVLQASVRYFGFSLVPLAWILLPLVILFVQLDRTYGHVALAPGETALVTVEAPDLADITLDADPGLAVETPSLREPDSHQAQWRIRGLIAGDHALTVRTAGQAATKHVSVGPGRPVLSTRRPSTGVVDQLLHPGEPPIPADVPVHAVEIQYRRATVSFLGWQVPWVVPFFVLTILFGFAMQKPLGVKL